MKRLSTAAITDSAQFPVKSGTLEFLQDAYKEPVDAICRNLIGNTYDSAKVYVLYGCRNSGSGADYVISEGAVYHNGELYLVDATSFTAVGTVIAVFATEQFTTNADPVTFTDGVDRSIHNINKISIIDSVSIAGICDYADFVDVTGNEWNTGNVVTGASITGVTGTIVSYNYFYLVEKNKVTLNYQVHVNITVGAGPTTFMTLGLPLPTTVSNPVGSYCYGMGAIVNLVDSTYGTVYCGAGVLGMPVLSINSDYGLPLGDYYIYGQIVYAK